MDALRLADLRQSDPRRTRIEQTALVELPQHAAHQRIEALEG